MNLIFYCSIVDGICHVRRGYGLLISPYVDRVPCFLADLCRGGGGGGGGLALFAPRAM